jgi:putative thioredoxin
VRQFIEKLIPGEKDLAFREANSLLATRHWPEAEDAFRGILDSSPHYQEAKLGLARALLAQGLGCEAQELLQEIQQGPGLAQVNRLRPLAIYLCNLEKDLDDLEMDPVEAQFWQAGRLLQRGNVEAAMDGFLDILRQDKQYRSGEPKEILLGLFELLGDDDPLTGNYRRELAMILF